METFGIIMSVLSVLVGMVVAMLCAVCALVECYKGDTSKMIMFAALVYLLAKA